jgi:hypothetical protein
VIEFISYPPNLAEWDRGKQPYYLELYGETRPVVDRRFAEAQPAGSVDGKAETISATPVYEYWWTIGPMYPSMNTVIQGILSAGWIETLTLPPM